MAMESENTKRLAEATYKLSNLDPRLKVNVKGKSYSRFEINVAANFLKFCIKPQASSPQLK